MDDLRSTTPGSDRIILGLSALWANGRTARDGYHRSYSRQEQSGRGRAKAMRAIRIAHGIRPGWAFQERIDVRERCTGLCACPTSIGSTSFGADVGRNGSQQSRKISIRSSLRFMPPNEGIALTWKPLQTIGRPHCLSAEDGERRALSMLSPNRSSSSPMATPRRWN